MLYMLVLMRWISLVELMVLLVNWIVGIDDRLCLILMSIVGWLLVSIMCIR